MLSAAENARLTGTDAGTPAGELLRRYWQPAALLDELDGGRPAVPVRLLGEDLVLFRGGDGALGLIGRQCPHRGVDLAYGRIEDGGLRCPFHGWLFDAEGRCLEQPAEPEGSTFHAKISHTAYPVAVRSGIVFAWMGPGAPPAFPEFDCFVAPDAYTFAFKGMIEANWLQALEVGIDPAHASFLHRFFEDEEPEKGYGRQFGDATAEIPVTRLLRDFPRPEIRVEPMEYGLRILALRDLGNRGRHVRVTNLAFPNAIVIPMSAEMTISQWHVPIDDTRCYWYAIFTAFEKPVDKARMREQRLELYRPPDYRAVRNRDNFWGFDPAEQRAKTYTGMGMDINVHDNWAVESPGAIYDRTTEHLGATDKAIIANRRLLAAAIDAVEQGRAAPMTPDAAASERWRGPPAVDTLCPPDGWEAAWRGWERDRRRRSPWAA